MEGVGVLVEYDAVIARPQPSRPRTCHRHYVADATQRVCVQSVSDLPLLLAPSRAYSPAIKSSTAFFASSRAFWRVARVALS